VKAGTQNHLKMKRFQKLLDVPLYQAVGILETLWLLCQDCCDDGRVGKYTDQEIADYLEWGGDPTVLIRCLSEAGWTDPDSSGRPIVHDWTEHCPEFIRERLRKREARRVKDLGCRTDGQERTGTDSNGQWRDQPPLVPSIPNQSQPNPTNPNSSGEPDKPASSQPVLLFPCVGSGAKIWELTQAKVAEYRESFPGIDVMAQCRAARQWCQDNPSRRKTFNGMAGFLSRWLTKAQNAQGTSGESIVSNGAAQRAERAKAAHRESAARDVILAGRTAGKTDEEITSDLAAKGLDWTA
jgi:hypothetical protein